MSVKVILDNCSGVYHPGQKLTGNIECVFNKRKTFKAIQIVYKGKGKTLWYESETYFDNASKKHRKRLVRYTSEEVYFENEQTLIQAIDHFSLPEGRYRYPFTYYLPEQLPSSFQGNYGSVEYTIKGIICRPWKVNYTDKLLIHICSPLNLNNQVGIRDRVSTAVCKDISCFCCTSEWITFKISTPVKGFCPGEPMNIEMHIDNQSHVTAEKVKFKIYKEIEFISHSPSIHYKRIEYLLAKSTEVGIRTSREKSLTSVIWIPTDDDYPNLLFCSIMDVTYHLRAKLVLSCFHSSVELTFPFIIGNIPLRDLSDTSTMPSSPLPHMSIEFLQNPSESILHSPEDGEKKIASDSESSDILELATTLTNTKIAHYRVHKKDALAPLDSKATAKFIGGDY